MSILSRPFTSSSLLPGADAGVRPAAGVQLRSRLKPEARVSVSAPVVQDIKAVGYGYAGCKQVANGPDDTTWREVTLWVVVPTNNKHARIVATDFHDEVMEIAEVVMVMGQQDTVLFDSPGQLHRIVLATHANVRRQGHVVPGITEQTCQQWPVGIVVQV